MIYGYARVSSSEQNLARQQSALVKYCKDIKIFMDKQSGKDFERPEYQKMKSLISKGDTLVVKELDRLGRNKDSVKEELQWFKNHEVIVRILEIPTTMIDFQGQDWVAEMVNNLLIEVLTSIAEQERVKIKERQAEGIRAKKERGEWGDYGRPRKYINNFSEYYQKQKNGLMTVPACQRTLILRKQKAGFRCIFEQNYQIWQEKKGYLKPTLPSF